MKNILKTKGLLKVYNYRTSNAYEALHRINLEVDEGEFVSIMGPSGCGNTTLLNTISTMDNPTGGRVLINGIDLRSLSANALGRFRYRHLGFVFQDVKLLKQKTIYENIAMPLVLSHKSVKEVKDRVLKLAKMLNIEDILHKYPNQCSTGQKQRCAICRALINHPSLIVADEPTGNLDSQNSIELLRIFKRLNEEEHTTIILVTHSVMVASFSTRFIYMKDGNILINMERGMLTQSDYLQKIADITTEDAKKIIA